MADKLTDKQQRFVEEYLIDLNATQAALRAGYSEKNVLNLGTTRMSKTRVAESVAEAQGKISKRTKVTVDRVVTGLLKEAENTDDGATHSARVAAWAHLGKHLGIFVEKVEQNVTVKYQKIVKEYVRPKN